MIFDKEARAIILDDAKIHLTPKEAQVFAVLYENLGKPVDRYEIEEKVWLGYIGGSNIVDVYIGYLRRKIDSSGIAYHIATVRGTGYLLETTGQSQE